MLEVLEVKSEARLRRRGRVNISGGEAERPTKEEIHGRSDRGHEVRWCERRGCRGWG